ncbi:uncharacterized protein LOC121654378 [Melanotaenia boesemani]|uniref:uncharacterized protein LOC121654378 n=1 Tax=Melanotaenia boesemani TaxID=1250792 RepID=UPI001C054413|nr:uncharacterized protein LOC121654378 [Melanotaenia boesemani]
MNPAGEVIWGQKVGITCSVSTQVLDGNFVLTKTRSSFNETQTLRTNSASFWIHKADFEDEGSYQCQYQTTGSSRYFGSPLSDPVRLSINMRLQRPNISLTSSNTFWSPEGAVVTKGSSFTFTCSINSSYTQGRFFLMFSSNVMDTKPAVNNSASFNFPVADYEHQGNYSCVYELTLSTRRFNSTEAPPITLVIKLSLLLLVSSISSGILLLLLVVLMVVCLVRRRRRNTQQPIALSQIQMDGRDRKTDDEDEDDEQDYENVDLVDMTKKVRKEETEEESDDYEEPVGDDDHDYEEAGPDLYCTNAKEISVSGEDYSEEDSEEDDEEEETSDEDDDYENVSPACEQIVDIYQQYEDVYQTF